jgi:hypothetical protein
MDENEKIIKSNIQFLIMFFLSKPQMLNHLLLQSLKVGRIDDGYLLQDQG